MEKTETTEIYMKKREKAAEKNVRSLEEGSG
jgi:hypothetical protein